MTSMQHFLTTEFNQAIAQALDLTDINPDLQPVSAPHFGDYQANFALKLAKKLQKKPSEIAQTVVAHLTAQNNAWLEQAIISGPGFINFSLKPDFLAQQLNAIAADARLGVAQAPAAGLTIVEYGSPNVAKEMHVGHLRTTIIGDALYRILSFLGHHVLRQSHIGDWGTQFGMLLAYLQENQIDLTQACSISEVSHLYRKAKQHFDVDPEFAQRAREQVVALQAGDAKALALWQTLVQASEQHFHDVYQRLGVLLTQADIRGESFYNPFLPNIVDELLARQIAVRDQGAAVVFLPHATDPKQPPLPFIIKKSDGGYLYATTDLAALKFRIEQLGAQRIIYVVDARQAQHFALLFATAKLAGWANDNIKLEHAAYGTVLGQDRKPFKTRSGETIELSALLAEAEKRAKEIVAQKAPDLSATQQAHIAHVIGMGALKYADLSTDKIKDYLFDWDRMLSFEGNTAPYLQNAYVRICALFRKSELDISKLTNQSIQITTTEERSLALLLLQFSATLERVAAEFAPHLLCHYLFNLASAFHKFYEHCPVLSAAETPLRDSRLRLADLTGRTLKLGLDLLGIAVVEQM